MNDFTKEKIQQYVFVDSNNGHYERYYNFTSNATKEQILNIIQKVDGNYRRLGMTISSMERELLAEGFKFNLLDNDRNRMYIDRIPIRGTMGNY